MEGDVEERVEGLVKDRLLEYYGRDLSEKELNIGPNVSYHEFGITQKGVEEAKDIYAIYYPDDDE